MEQKLLSTDRLITMHYVFLTEISLYVWKNDSECQVNLITGAQWKLIHTTIGTINFSEKPVETSAGTKYVSELSAIIPGHSNLTPGEIHSVTGRKVAVMLTYRSGLMKIVGGRGSGPKMEISISGNKTTQRSVQFSWESIYPNQYVQVNDSGNGVGV